jgi:hypothetical protein
MNNKWKLACVGIAAAAALPAQGPGWRGPGMGFGPGPRTPVTGAPYSAVETVQFQQTLPGGNQIQRQEESRVFRDSQGRVRTERTVSAPAATGQTPETVITIYDPVAGYFYRLDPQTKTAFQTPVRVPGPSQPGGSTPPFRNGPNGGNVQIENLGAQTVNGIPATGTRMTRTIPAGAIGNQQPIQIVRETWVSPDLKVPVLIKSSDPRFGNSTMQLTNITQGEPDPSLFQVPSGYTIETRPGGRGGMSKMTRKPEGNR